MRPSLQFLKNLVVLNQFASFNEKIVSAIPSDLVELATWLIETKKDSFLKVVIFSKGFDATRNLDVISPSKQKNARSLLMKAVLAGNEHAVKWLLDVGVDPDLASTGHLATKNHLQEYPFELAYEMGLVAIFLLLAKQSRITLPHNPTAGLQLLGAVRSLLNQQNTPIDFTNIDLGNNGIKILAAALKNYEGAPLSLTLAQSGLMTEGVQHLIAAFNAKHHFKLLNFSSNPLADKDTTQLLKAICSLGSVESLSLANLPIAEAGISYIVNQLSIHKQLENLNLNNCRLSNRSFAMLAQLIAQQKTTLTALDISNNRTIESNHVALFRAMEENTFGFLNQFKSLGFYNCGSSLAVDAAIMTLGKLHNFNLKQIPQYPAFSALKMLPNVLQGAQKEHEKYLSMFNKGRHKFIAAELKDNGYQINCLLTDLINAQDGITEIYDSKNNNIIARFVCRNGVLTFEEMMPGLVLNLNVINNAKSTLENFIINCQNSALTLKTDLAVDHIFSVQSAQFILAAESKLVAKISTIKSRAINIAGQVRTLNSEIQAEACDINGILKSDFESTINVKNLQNRGVLSVQGHSVINAAHYYNSGKVDVAVTASFEAEDYIDEGQLSVNLFAKVNAKNIKILGHQQAHYLQLHASDNLEIMKSAEVRSVYTKIKSDRNAQINGKILASKNTAANKKGIDRLLSLVPNIKLPNRTGVEIAGSRVVVENDSIIESPDLAIVRADEVELHAANFKAKQNLVQAKKLSNKARFEGDTEIFAAEQCELQADSEFTLGNVAINAPNTNSQAKFINSAQVNFCSEKLMLSNCDVQASSLGIVSVVTDIKNSHFTCDKAAIYSEKTISMDKNTTAECSDILRITSLDINSEAKLKAKNKLSLEGGKFPDAVGESEQQAALVLEGSIKLSEPATVESANYAALAKNYHSRARLIETNVTMVHADIIDEKTKLLRAKACDLVGTTKVSTKSGAQFQGERLAVLGRKVIIGSHLAPTETFIVRGGHYEKLKNDFKFIPAGKVKFKRTAQCNAKKISVISDLINDKGKVHGSKQCDMNGKSVVLAESSSTQGENVTLHSNQLTAAGEVSGSIVKVHSTESPILQPGAKFHGEENLTMTTEGTMNSDQISYKGKRVVIDCDRSKFYNETQLDADQIVLNSKRGAELDCIVGNENSTVIIRDLQSVALQEKCSLTARNALIETKNYQGDSKELQVENLEVNADHALQENSKNYQVAFSKLNSKKKMTLGKNLNAKGTVFTAIAPQLNTNAKLDYQQQIALCGGHLAHDSETNKLIPVTDGKLTIEPSADCRTNKLLLNANDILGHGYLQGREVLVAESDNAEFSMTAQLRGGNVIVETKQDQTINCAIGEDDEGSVKLIAQGKLTLDEKAYIENPKITLYANVLDCNGQVISNNPPQIYFGEQFKIGPKGTCESIPTKKMFMTQPVSVDKNSEGTRDDPNQTSLLLCGGFKSNGQNTLMPFVRFSEEELLKKKFTVRIEGALKSTSHVMITLPTKPTAYYLGLLAGQFSESGLPSSVTVTSTGHIFGPSGVKVVADELWNGNRIVTHATFQATLNCAFINGVSDTSCIGLAAIIAKDYKINATTYFNFASTVRATHSATINAILCVDAGLNISHQLTNNSIISVFDNQALPDPQGLYDSFKEMNLMESVSKVFKFENPVSDCLSIMSNVISLAQRFCPAYAAVYKTSLKIIQLIGRASYIKNALAELDKKSKVEAVIFADYIPLIVSGTMLAADAMYAMQNFETVKADLRAAANSARNMYVDLRSVTTTYLTNNTLFKVAIDGMNLPGVISYKMAVKTAEYCKNAAEQTAKLVDQNASYQQKIKIGYQTAKPILNYLGVLPSYNQTSAVRVSPIGINMTANINRTTAFSFSGAHHYDLGLSVTDSSIVSYKGGDTYAVDIFISSGSMHLMKGHIRGLASSLVADTLSQSHGNQLDINGMLCVAQDLTQQDSAITVSGDSFVDVVGKTAQYGKSSFIVGKAQSHTTQSNPNLSSTEKSTVEHAVVNATNSEFKANINHGSVATHDQSQYTIHEGAVKIGNLSVDGNGAQQNFNHGTQLKVGNITTDHGGKVSLDGLRNVVEAGDLVTKNESSIHVKNSNLKANSLTQTNKSHVDVKHSSLQITQDVTQHDSSVAISGDSFINLAAKTAQHGKSSFVVGQELPKANQPALQITDGKEVVAPKAEEIVTSENTEFNPNIIHGSVETHDQSEYTIHEGSAKIGSLLVEGDGAQQNFNHGTKLKVGNVTANNRGKNVMDGIAGLLEANNLSAQNGGSILAKNTRIKANDVTVSRQGKIALENLHDITELAQALVEEGGELSLKNLDAKIEKTLNVAQTGTLKTHNTTAEAKEIHLAGKHEANDVTLTAKTTFNVTNTAHENITGAVQYQGDHVTHNGTTQINKNSQLGVKANVFESRTANMTGDGSVLLDYMSGYLGSQITTAGLKIKTDSITNYMDLISGVGQYANIAPTQSFWFETNNALTISHGFQRNHNVYLTGSEIDIQTGLNSHYDLGFNATKGSVTTRQGIYSRNLFLHAEQNVYLQQQTHRAQETLDIFANNDIYGDHAQGFAKEIYLQAGRDNYLRSSQWHATNYIKTYSGNMTFIDALERTEKHKHKTIKIFDQTKFIAGAGIGHDDIGFEAYAGNKLISGYTNISAVGGIKAQGKYGSELKTQVGQEIKEQTKKGWFRKKTIIRKKEIGYSTDFTSALADIDILSEEGKILREGAKTTALQGETHLHGKHGITEDAPLLKKSKATYRDYVWGTHSRSKKSHENDVPNVNYDTGYFAKTDGAYLATGSVFLGDGPLRIEAKKGATIESQILTHRFMKEEWTFGVSAFGLNAATSFAQGNPGVAFMNLLREDPTISSAIDLLQSDSLLQGGANLSNLAISGYNSTAQIAKAINEGSLKNTLLERYGLGSVEKGFDPSVTFNVGHNKSRGKYQTLGSGAILKNDVQIIAEEGDAKFGNGIYVTDLDNLAIKANNFEQTGARLQSSFRNRGQTLSVGVSASFDVVSVGAGGSYSRNQSETWQNQVLNAQHVSLDLKEGRYSLDAANANFGVFTNLNKLDDFTIRSRQDKTHSLQQSFKVATDGNCDLNINSESSKHLNQASGIHVREQATNFHTNKHTNIGGYVSVPTDQDFRADVTKQKSLRDKQHQTGMSVSGNVNSFQSPPATAVEPKKTNLAPITTMNVGASFTRKESKRPAGTQHGTQTPGFKPIAKKDIGVKVTNLKVPVRVNNIEQANKEIKKAFTPTASSFATTLAKLNQLPEIPANEDLAQQKLIAVEKATENAYLFDKNGNLPSGYIFLDGPQADNNLVDFHKVSYTPEEQTDLFKSMAKELPNLQHEKPNLGADLVIGSAKGIKRSIMALDTLIGDILVCAAHLPSSWSFVKDSEDRMNARFEGIVDFTKEVLSIAVDGATIQTGAHLKVFAPEIFNDENNTMRDIYQDAIARNQHRGQVIKDAMDRYVALPREEKIAVASQLITDVLLPKAIAKAAAPVNSGASITANTAVNNPANMRATATATDNFYKFGMREKPPVFKNIRIDDLHLSCPPTTPISTQTILTKKTGPSSISAMYFIDKHGKLTITFRYSEFVPIAPHEITRMQNLAALGLEHIVPYNKISINGKMHPFAQLKNNDMLIYDLKGEYPIGQKMLIKHPEIANLEDVIGAGEIHFGNKRIFGNNHSGHYQPWGRNLEANFRRACERNGLGQVEFLQTFRESPNLPVSSLSSEVNLTNVNSIPSGTQSSASFFKPDLNTIGQVAEQKTTSSAIKLGGEY